MKWDSFELNKLAAAGLLALLIGMICAKISDALVEPEQIAKSVYIVQGLEVVATAGGAPAKEGPEPIEPFLAKSDIERGKVVAKKCAACHTFNKGDPNRIGPNLYAIVGSKVAEVAGYSFSKAMSGLGGVWSIDRLSDYLYKPAAYVKGTKMSFAGLTNPQERADVIAYLNSLSDSPQPLPTASPKGAEEAAKPAEGAKPAEPGKAGQAGKTAEAGKPAEGAKPAGAGKTAEAGKPAEGAKPAGAGKTAEAGKPAEGAKPAEAGKTAAAAKPAEGATPAEGAEKQDHAASAAQSQSDATAK